MIRLENVTKSYRSRGRTTLVLDRVNAVFPTGAAVALLGRNGSGKSTLLNVLAGRVTDVRGTVEVRSRSLGHLPQEVRFRDPGATAASIYSASRPPVPLRDLGLRQRVMAYPMVFALLVALWSLREKHKLGAKPQPANRLMVNANANRAAIEL